MNYHAFVKFEVVFKSVFYANIHVGLSKIHILGVVEVIYSALFYISVSEVLALRNFFVFVNFLVVGYKVNLVKVLVKKVRNIFNGIVREIIIGVDKHNVFALSFIDTEISCRGNAAVFVVKHFEYIVFFCISVANFGAAV